LISRKPSPDIIHALPFCFADDETSSPHHTVCEHLHTPIWVEIAPVAETETRAINPEHMVPIRKSPTKLVVVNLASNTPDLHVDLDKADHKGALPDKGRPGIHLLSRAPDELEDALCEQLPLLAHQTQPRRPTRLGRIVRQSPPCKKVSYFQIRWTDLGLHLSSKLGHLAGRELVPMEDLVELPNLGRSPSA
jgi:hypothetical protein